jgi:putative isomerase
MHERRPDMKFLTEVYEALVRWHDWWLRARDGNHNGLLEWGSEQHSFNGAQLEPGGTTMSNTSAQS